ncbi:triple tyrosine motif-containing protein, partial [Arthrospira platensis SPKY1]|nr:triple tyrosine motif-containing protein [Arthrospira platensis SPKY1]
HGQWSKWSPVSSFTIENLPPGKYTFKVKANVANTPTDNIATYEFQILKPWYANHWSIGVYLVLLLVMAFIINKLYNDYHNKRHQKIIAENNILLELKELESQKEIMKIRNEQLTQDVDKKSKELAVSTMNLMKKDELLQIIKEDLKQTTESNPSKKIKSVISAINSTVN